MRPNYIQCGDDFALCIMDWEGYEKTLPWPILMYCLKICLDIS